MMLSECIYIYMCVCVSHTYIYIHSLVYARRYEGRRVLWALSLAGELASEPR